MALPDPIDTITQAIADPSSVSADGVAITARSADDQIKLLNYGAMLAALRNNHNFGIRRTQMIAQGPVNSGGGQLDVNFNQGLI